MKFSHLIKLLIIFVLFNSLSYAQEQTPIGLDVRSFIELKMNPAPGAIAIPLSDVSEKVSEQIKDKQATIHVFCEAGARAQKALTILKSMGYTNVKNIGSWREWNQEQAKLKKNNGESPKKEEKK